ncbi:MAG: RNA chaperone Hfq [Alphaproteobacteria bacterium]|nr:RNA chaperone Hfq [Alphaproteobacteria bacterium]
MTKTEKNVQTSFLETLKNDKVSVTIYLMCGVKLQGIVTQFDENSILLRRDGHSQLVYKHAVSTIMPSTSLQLFDAEDAS